MRTIDADALEARMYHDAFETDTDMQRWDSGCWIRYKMFEKAIVEAPTIEPERKTGKWLPHYCEEDGEKDGIECSECGSWYWCGGKTLNYCPDCGARMKDKEGDT